VPELPWITGQSCRGAEHAAVRGLAGSARHLAYAPTLARGGILTLLTNPPAWTEPQ